MSGRATILENAVNTTIENCPLVTVARDYHDNKTVFESNLNDFNQLLYDHCAEGARYDSSLRSEAAICMEGTREKALKDIFGCLRDDRGPRVVWLEAPAGVGKSTIAQTVAERFANERLLGASFFFARNNEQCSSIHRLFPTIAYQLSLSVPALRTAILETVQGDRGIFERRLRGQFKALIQDPIERTRQSPNPPTRIVVIDALDECKDQASAKEVLEIIVQALFDGLGELKFLITGRPELYLRAALAETSFRLKIIDLTRYAASTDIRLYLERELAQIRHNWRNHRELAPIADSHPGLRGPDRPWPEPSDFDLLVQRSANLFIFASTAISIIEDSKFLPNKQLKKILDQQPSARMSSLDRLYYDIVCNLPKQPPCAEVAAILILLFDSISISTLRALVQPKYDDIGTAPEQLRSVFAIPDNESGLIGPCHLSFREFLTDRERSDTHYIDPSVCHGEIALMCFQLMDQTLKQDICGLVDSQLEGGRWLDDYSRLNSEFKNLAQRRKQFINPALAYACRYWASHLVQSAENVELVEALMSFERKSLLFWLEVLSLLEGLEAVPDCLRDATTWVQSLGDKNISDKAIKSFNEVGYFYSICFESIKVSALSIYRQASLFLPTSSPLARQPFLPDTTIRLADGRETHWNPQQQVLKPSSLAQFLVFLRKGTAILTISVYGEIEVWDTSSGLKLASLESDGEGENKEKKVLSVTTSPNGILLAVEFSDASAVWNLKSNRRISLSATDQTVFLPDDSGFGAMLKNGEIWLFNTSGERTANLRVGDDTRFCSVFISPNGVYLTAKFNDEQGEKLAVWFTKTTRLVSVASCTVFLPDGGVITASNLGGIKLWNTSGIVSAKFVARDLVDVRSLSISPGGVNLAATFSGGFAVWTIKPARLLVKLAAIDVRFLSDSALAIFTRDGRLELRNTFGEIIEMPTGLSAGKLVDSLPTTTSPNSNYLAATFADGGNGGQIVEVWNIKTSKLVRIIKIVGSITCLRFSQNGNFLLARCGKHKTYGCDISRRTLVSGGYMAVGEEFVDVHPDSYEVDKSRNVPITRVHAKGKEVITLRTSSQAYREWGITSSVLDGPSGEKVSFDSRSITYHPWQSNSISWPNRFGKVLASAISDRPGVVATSHEGGDGRAILHVATAGSVVIWNAFRVVGDEHFGHSRSLAASLPNGSRFVVQESSGSLELLDELGQLICSLGDLLKANDYKVVFSPNSAIIAVWRPDSLRECFSLFSESDGRFLGDGKVKPPASFDHLVFSGDSKFLFGGQRDGTIRMFDVTSRQELATCKVDDRIYSLESSTDSDEILTVVAEYSLDAVGFEFPVKITFGLDQSGEKNSLFRFRTTSLQRERNRNYWTHFSTTSHALRDGIGKHPASFYHFVFSGDSKFLFGAQGDGTIRMFDVTSRQELATCKVDDRIYSLESSTDSDEILTVVAEYPPYPVGYQFPVKITFGLDQSGEKYALFRFRTTFLQPKPNRNYCDPEGDDASPLWLNSLSTTSHALRHGHVSMGNLFDDYKASRYHMQYGWLVYETKRLLWIPPDRRTNMFVARDGIIVVPKPLLILDVRNAIRPR